MNERAHPHADGGGHQPTRGHQRRSLFIALAANGAFLVVEVVGGLAFRSLALLADAAHMLSDVVGLSIALVAQRLLLRPATTRHSYGLQRAEVVGGQLNGLILLSVAGWVVYEAIRRIGQPVDVAGGGMLAVATVGLAVNVASALVLARAQGRSINMRGAYLHMLLDAAASVGTIVAAVAVVVWEAGWADPAVSLLISALVIWSAWSLLRDTTNVMLEATPGYLDQAEVEAALTAEAPVVAVHHVHLWSLASDVAAFSGHVVLHEEVTLHQAQVEGDRLKAMLADRFQIDHVTLELECHDCQPPSGGDGALTGPDHHGSGRDR